MDGEKNYSFYNGSIDLPRVNKFASPTHVSNNVIDKSEEFDADNSFTSSSINSPGRSINSPSLFIPRPPTAGKAKIVKAQVHTHRRVNKVAPEVFPLVHSNRLPPLVKESENQKLQEENLPYRKDEHWKLSNEVDIIQQDREDIPLKSKADGTITTQDNHFDTPRQKSKHTIQDAKELSQDQSLISKYKDFINSRYSEECFHEKLNDSSSDDGLSVSVSSLSDNDEEVGKTLTTNGFEPLYSLPTKGKSRNKDNMFNKIVISNSNTLLSEDPLCKTGRSLPDLRSVDKFSLKRVSHVAKNESEAESEPGAQIGYKFKPLPPIPGTTSNISNTGLYETIDGLSKLQANPSTDYKNPTRRKTFKEIATILTLVPRLTTKSVRSRKNDHLLADILKYLPDKKLKIFVGTWNMKGTKSLPASLDDFLLPPESIYLQDVYVIGTQEGTPFRHEWQIRLQETFGPSHVLMQASNFGVLQLSVFVRRELVWFCSSVEQDTIATRVGHKIKTKGALAMSFSIFGTSLLFLTSHFTSDKEKLEDRINDYRTISQSIQLPYDDPRDEKDVTNRFDRVFWFGDFNFRIQKSREHVDKVLSKRHSTKSNCEEQLIADLLQHDQLNQLFVRGKIFHGFTESPIRFMPTYKFDVNTSTYDTSSKQRVPSWTDRILYKSSPQSSITCLNYDSCNSITVSDHRAVYGIFEADVEPYKNNFTVPGASFNREVYVEANLRRNAPHGSQNNSNICTIL